MEIPEFKFAVKEGLDESFLPLRADSRATGWDVRAAKDVVFHPTSLEMIPLGIRCFAPEGYWLELRPRSSTFGKKELSSLYGVIDCNFEGELLFACKWNPYFRCPPPFYSDRSAYDLSRKPSHDNPDARIVGSLYAHFSRKFVIEKGERIGQLVPVRRQEMLVKGITNEEFDTLCKQRGLERGAGGFGSTG
jgi:dUTPase